MVGIDDSGVAALHAVVEVCEKDVPLPLGRHVRHQRLHEVVERRYQGIKVRPISVAVENGRDDNLGVRQVADETVHDIGPCLKDRHHGVELRQVVHAYDKQCDIGRTHLYRERVYVLHEVAAVGERRGAGGRAMLCGVPPVLVGEWRTRRVDRVVAVAETVHASGLHLVAEHFKLLVEEDTVVRARRLRIVALGDGVAIAPDDERLARRLFRGVVDAQVDRPRTIDETRGKAGCKTVRQKRPDLTVARARRRVPLRRRPGRERVCSLHERRGVRYRNRAGRRDRADVQVCAGLSCREVPRRVRSYGENLAVFRVPLDIHQFSRRIIAIEYHDLFDDKAGEGNHVVCICRLTGIAAYADGRDVVGERNGTIGLFATSHYCQRLAYVCAGAVALSGTQQVSAGSRKLRGISRDAVGL